MTFLYGALGARPVRFTAQGQEHAKMVARMFPGALNVGTYIDATWDVAELVAAELGVPSPSMPQLGPAHLAGLDYASWEALGLTTKLREYQREGALFLAVRSSAYLADQMRLGKTRTLVAGAVLSGARRVLILAPAMVRRVWPREILGLTGCQTVVCMGRAGSYGRLTCTCLGTPAAASCPVCKGRGFTKLEGAAFDKAFAEARFVLSSFDILMPQMRRTKEGGMNAQAHLPGFSARLAAERWGVIIGDEFHRVRGFSTSDAKKGKTRREYLTRVADQADRVWLASGTPIAARIRDLWAQLDIMTKGASSGNWTRTPFSWDAAYCEGQHNELGFWQAKGVSPRALVELPRRLKHLMLRREKKDVFTQLPARTEEVLKLPADAKSAKASRRLLLGLGSKQEKLKRALSATTDAKTDAVAELAAEQASAGEKVIVFVYNIDTPAKVAKAVRDLTKAAPVKIWTVSGEMPVDERILAGEDFVAHKSGGVFIATMDSTSEGVSLKGASTVYFLALHEVPATLAQAADRPWDPNTAAYTVVYVTMEGAVDDLYLKRLRPKLAALEVVGDTSLTQLRANIESEDMMTSGPQFDNLLDDMIAAVREEQARDLDAELRELGVDL